MYVPGNNGWLWHQREAGSGWNLSGDLEGASRRIPRQPAAKFLRVRKLRRHRLAKERTANCPHFWSCHHGHRSGEKISVWLTGIMSRLQEISHLPVRVRCRFIACKKKLLYFHCMKKHTETMRPYLPVEWRRQKAIVIKPSHLFSYFKESLKA